MHMKHMRIKHAYTREESKQQGISGNSPALLWTGVAEEQDHHYFCCLQTPTLEPAAGIIYIICSQCFVEVFCIATNISLLTLHTAQAERCLCCDPASAFPTHSSSCMRIKKTILTCTETLFALFTYLIVPPNFYQLGKHDDTSKRPCRVTKKCQRPPFQTNTFHQYVQIFSDPDSKHLHKSQISVCLEVILTASQFQKMHKHVSSC